MKSPIAYHQDSKANQKSHRSPKTKPTTYCATCKGSRHYDQAVSAGKTFRPEMITPICVKARQIGPVPIMQTCEESDRIVTVHA